MNKRKWICRIIGALLVLLGIYLLVIGYEYTLIISAATIVLIIGVAVWMNFLAAFSSWQMENLPGHLRNSR